VFYVGRLFAVPAAQGTYMDYGYLQIASDQDSIVPRRGPRWTGVRSVETAPLWY